MQRLATAVSSPTGWPQTGIIGGINSIEKKDVVYCSSIQENGALLPVGQLVAGIVTSKSSVSEEEIKTLCDSLIPRKTGQAVFLSPKPESGLDAKQIDLKSGKITAIEAQVVEDKEFLDELMVVKVVGSVKVDCNADKDSLNQFLEDFTHRTDKLSFNLTDTEYDLQSG